jgi:hypothetical protein
MQLQRRVAATYFNAGAVQSVRVSKEDKTR